MAEHWIPASKAIAIVTDAIALCSRLRAGLLSARAELLIIDHKEERSARIPQGFWWSEGHSDLEQNWQTGDFETWIDHKVHCKAFGITIALSGILEMLPIEQRASVARSLSVAGNPLWVSAKQLREHVYTDGGVSPHRAGSKIMEMARLGFVQARAVTAELEVISSTRQKQKLDFREWDVPLWFWTSFTLESESFQDWELGRFSGQGRGPDGVSAVVLRGVHFTSDSLAAFLPVQASSPEPESSSRGRKPTYDWATASSVVWGKLHRGDLKPETQAEIEAALISVLTKGDVSPSESTVRPYAKPIWEQFQIP